MKKTVKEDRRERELEWEGKKDDLKNKDTPKQQTKQSKRNETIEFVCELVFSVCAREKKRIK